MFNKIYLFILNTKINCAILGFGYQTIAFEDNSFIKSSFTIKFFTFSCRNIRSIDLEKILFWVSNFWNRDFDGFTRFVVPWIRKSHFKRLICMHVYVCVCVSVISITQKQITAETSKSVFYICIMYRCYLKILTKIGQKLCVQGHTKEF